MVPGETILQVDHAIIGRSHDSTFFDLSNSITLCKTHHSRKTFDKRGTGYKVHKIVEQREGEEAIEELIQLSHTVKKWTIQELEDVKQILDSMYQEEENATDEKLLA